MIEVKLTFYIDLPEDTECGEIYREFKKKQDSCIDASDFLQWREVDPKTYKPIEEPNADF